MDDNVWPHRTLAVEELLESEDITRMDWPAYSPELNTNEHVWDALGRRIAARLHHPENTQQLKQMLIEEWALLPQEMLHQQVLSMRRRCEASIARLWDQYQSEDSVSRRPVPGRPRATTPAEDRFLALSARRRTTTVPQLVADHFQASGRRISATTVRNRLHNAGLYARRPVVCVPLNGRQRRNHLCWAREHVSWTQQQWASVLFTDESRFTMESDSGRLLIWREQRTRYHQSNTVERHSYRGGRILILDPYVRPYAAAIGNDFILMDDNARPHRAGIVEEYLEDHGLERMEWPARSPDLNPIEHLWDYLGREVAALNPPPRSLHELKQGLLCVWSSLPIPVDEKSLERLEMSTSDRMTTPTPRCARKEERSWLNWEE
ncbi:transposable element Tcb2 transposase [Trichonephila clavipes]|nr:transposable element Tcb2 transposase [Trichonephila clavipes]